MAQLIYKPKEDSGGIAVFSTHVDLDNGKESIAAEPRHDKTNKMSVRPAKTRISLGIHPV